MSEPGFAAQLAEDLSPDDLLLVLGVFRTDVERLTGSLDAAAAAADEAAFRRAAHGLAGAAGAVGAAGLEHACRQAMAGSQSLAAALADIRDTARGALAALDALLVRLGARA
jgi:HPt (histidine-containing phosphotransfer) domain-containing protein